MMLETYSNQLFLSRKIKPKAMTAKDGTFGLLLLAYSKPHANSIALVPWRLLWSGDDALGFWCHSGPALTPGAVVAVELTGLVLLDGSGKNRAPEMHAQVNSLQVVPKAPKSKDNPFFYDKSAAGACVASVSSY
jgi:hypothetical protein